MTSLALEDLVLRSSGDLSISKAFWRIFILLCSF